MPMFILFQASCVAWFASELWIGWRRRSDDAQRTHDAGTLRLLLVTIYASIALSVWLGTMGFARFPDEARAALFRIGVAMMIAGMAIRFWSVRTLAAYFTVDVTIRPGHELIRSGPYRWLRHPSYTGSLLTFFGFAACLGDALALAAVLIPVTLAFLWRIRIEERVLAEAFPQQYPAYARDTWRLVPLLW